MTVRSESAHLQDEKMTSTLIIYNIESLYSSLNLFLAVNHTDALTMHLPISF